MTENKTLKEQLEAWKKRMAEKREQEQAEAEAEKKRSQRAAVRPSKVFR